MAPPPLMEEILLRFPPHEPALLFRASLVCKRWRRLVSGPGFRRRFRDSPPLLGLLCNIPRGTSTARFVPTASSFCLPEVGLGSRRALDARHGRVLLQCRRGSGNSTDELMVWDPITGEKLEVPSPPRQWHMFSWTAAVLCAACGRCGHLDCHRGPFLVVYIGCGSGKWFICTYSSDAGTWSKPITSEQKLGTVNLMPSVLLGNALYFGLLFRKALLKYDLESHEMSVIGVPTAYPHWRHIVLDGGLGFATVQGYKLCIWKNVGPEVDAGWTQDIVIELEKLLPSPNKTILTSSFVVGCTDGSGVIFLKAGHVLFTVDLKTSKAKKVWEGKNIYSVIPYTSFCTPGLGAACTDEGSSVCGSGA